MQTDEKTLRRVYGMSFARVYPLYVAKVVRCLDKLVDELATGRAMEKILRSPAP